jgi:hypothetical protein
MFLCLRINLKIKPTKEAKTHWTNEPTQTKIEIAAIFKQTNSKMIGHKLFFLNVTFDKFRKAFIKNRSNPRSLGDQKFW